MFVVMPEGGDRQRRPPRLGFGRCRKNRRFRLTPPSGCDALRWECYPGVIKRSWSMSPQFDPEGWYEVRDPEHIKTGEIKKGLYYEA